MKCKYYDKCEHASSSALTCTSSGGGTYCGKYRVFSAGACECGHVSFRPQPGARAEEILA
ncbi:hypothetical protein [Methanolobus psychrotolerans]|uniref:hypothetical protein n=1 Tax=Methanolobus psychrotolerans TaxID=1874706 RepID=UPI00101ADE4A|nr:hypothetical protein [Methanolobus psychrotolerans]